MNDAPPPTPHVVYLLERDGELLARLTLLQADELGYHCSFEPTPAFQPYRALFDEDATLARELDRDSPAELVDRARALTEQMLDLDLCVRAEDGSEDYRQVLLGINGDRADFQPLDGA